MNHDEIILEISQMLESIPDFDSDRNKYFEFCKKISRHFEALEDSSSEKAVLSISEAFKTIGEPIADAAIWSISKIDSINTTEELEDLLVLFSDNEYIAGTIQDKLCSLNPEKNFHDGDLEIQWEILVQLIENNNIDQLLKILATTEKKLDFTDFVGKNLLWPTVDTANIDILKELIKNGFNYNHIASDGTTLKEHAAYSKDVNAAAKWLVDSFDTLPKYA